MVTTKTKAENDGDAVQETCIHHWVIDSPEGPASRGKCKLCGAEDEFINYVSYPAWHDIKWKNQESDLSDMELTKTSSGFQEGRVDI